MVMMKIMMMMFWSQGLQGLQQPVYGYEDLQMMQQAARLPLVSEMVVQGDDATPLTETPEKAAVCPSGPSDFHCEN